MMTTPKVVNDDKYNKILPVMINNKICLRNMDAPGDMEVKIWQNLKVLHFDPAPTPWYMYVKSVKCERPLDELTVHVLLLYHHLNFKYCTLYVDGTQTGVQIDNQITRCPWQTFQAGGIKIIVTNTDYFFLYDVLACMVTGTFNISVLSDTGRFTSRLLSPDIRAWPFILTACRWHVFRYSNKSTA